VSNPFEDPSPMAGNRHMAEKKHKPHKPQDLFKRKKQCSGEVKSIQFNDVLINYSDDGQVFIFIGEEETCRMVVLTPMDAAKLADFMIAYKNQLPK
jgi:hypothetical protein